MAKRTGLPLGIWTAVVIALLIVLTIGSAAAVTWVYGQRFARKSVQEVLAGSRATHLVLQRQRYRQLELISRILRTDQVLTSYLAEPSKEDNLVALLDTIEEYQDLLSFDLAVVLDRDGRVLRRTDGRDAVGEDYSAMPLVATAFEESTAIGVWPDGEGLYHAAAVRLARQFERVGCIIVAFGIDDALALQVQRSGGAQTVYLVNSPTGPAVVAGTLDPALRSELVPALRRRGEVLSRVTRQGQTEDRVELVLQDRQWNAFLEPLKDATGNAVGAAVTLASPAERIEGFRQVLLVLAGLGAVALLVGPLVAILLGRHAMKPVRAMTAAVERIALDDLQVSLPSGSGEMADLTGALGRLVRSLREKVALEHLLGRVSRWMPEPAKGSAAERPKAADLVLVAVEMRRFANPRTSYDPEENIGRFGRDLKRIAAAAESRNGRVEAVQGHRILAVFEGENHAFRGLCAATEILLTLSERESVFDEPEPPVVAATCGTVVSGTVTGTGRPLMAVAGLAVQQLESLLREAVPGELYLSKQLFTELGPAFEQAGVTLRPQRGLLSPQPLYVLSAAQAGQVTGVTAPSEAAAGFPDERRSLSDLKPGVVLGNRFDILAELGASSMGLSFKAQDRELGDLVTLKMLKPEVVANAAHFEWLRGYIQQARVIRHPNVLAVYDFGEADGLPYVSTEFDRGVTLRFLLDKSPQLPALAALRLARQVCKGLLAMHGERLLHRGVEPEKILLAGSGEARLTDLGMTLPMDAGAAVSGVEYISPELLAGGEADQRADLYSLGAVLYESLTDQVPYAGASPDEIRNRHSLEEAQPPSTLCEMPPELDRVVLRCLAKSPEQRYTSAAEVMKALDSVPV